MPPTVRIRAMIARFELRMTTQDHLRAGVGRSRLPSVSRTFRLWVAGAGLAGIHAAARRRLRFGRRTGSRVAGALFCLGLSGGALVRPRTEDQSLESRQRSVLLLKQRDQPEQQAQQPAQQLRILLAKLSLFEPGDERFNLGRVGGIWIEFVFHRQWCRFYAAGLSEARATRPNSKLSRLFAEASRCTDVLTENLERSGRKMKEAKSIVASG